MNMHRIADFKDWKPVCLNWTFKKVTRDQMEDHLSKLHEEKLLCGTFDLTRNAAGYLIQTESPEDNLPFHCFEGLHTDSGTPRRIYASASENYVAESDFSVAKPMKRLTIEVSEELHHSIKVKCFYRGKKVGDVIRDMLERKFKQAPSMTVD